MKQPTGWMKRCCALVVLSAALALVVSAQPKTIQPDDPLPVDAKIKVGKLPNGLVYYIRENHKPEKRAELRLAVRTGSVMEDDDQQGLAHFVEHMCFNGTKNFPKQELVNFLESTGVRFGPELNAYTSFDETVYMLQVPTDTAGILEKGFNVLGDWACNLSLDDTEIDKERGVVGEEWRLGRGAQQRIAYKQYPVLLYQSQYAKRLPIGQKEILDSFKYDVLKRFYRDWYRPDLMAVAAVGDFDAAAVEKLIVKHFSGMKNPEHERVRTEYSIPNHDQTLVVTAVDKEMPRTMVQIFFKRDQRKEKVAGDYRKSIVSRLFDAMINSRIEERLQKPNPPIVAGFAGSQSFIGDKDAFILVGLTKETGVLDGAKFLLEEAMRVQQHGFTQAELDREKKSMLRGFEQSYNEREKTESRSLVDEYVRNFLDQEPIPGIEYEYELHKQFLPGITLAEVNALIKENLTASNRVIAVGGPEKAGVTMPTEQELLAVVGDAAKMKTTPYEEKAIGTSILPALPKGGSVVATKNLESVGAVEWTLSNGIRVVAKATDFKNDEIVFTSFSPGGVSLAPESDYMSDSWASLVPQVSGVGAFDQMTLQKMLAGKIVNVTPYVGENFEGFQGSTSPKDLETAFQLIYAHGTMPRLDTTALNAYKVRIRSFLQNRSADPQAVFQDTMAVTMARYHYSAKPPYAGMVDEVDLQKSFAFLKDRFKDQGDFVFFFVGAFSPDTLKMLCERYLAALPSVRRNESWRDMGVRTPEGAVDKKVYKGVDQKSTVSIMFTGPFEWTTRNRFELQTMMEVLNIKLRETLREEKGGTYGVRANASPSHYPDPSYRITIGWGCAPNRVDELIASAMLQIDSLKNYPVAESYVVKARELQKRTLETNMKRNQFWLDGFSSYYQNGEDIALIPLRMKWIEEVNAGMIQKAAQKFFDLKNVARFVLYPEEKK